MAPPHSDPSSDSDEAPEALTLSQTKGAAQKQNAALREVEAAQNQKKRAKNRERDRKLKEQAEERRKGRKKDDEDFDEDVDDEQEEADEEAENDAEMRMLRAMKQAEEEEEDSEEDDEEKIEEDDDKGMEEANEGEASDDEDEDEDEDEEMRDEEDEEEDEDEEDSDLEMDSDSIIPLRSKAAADRLPDHLFTSAFSTSSTKPSKKPKTTKPNVKKQRRKRSGPSNAPKDLIVGSRAIRMLPAASNAPRASAAMVPSSKVKKFLERNLSGTRGADKSRTRGWERRAANLGSMKRQGPAAHFVRAS